MPGDDDRTYFGRLIATQQWARMSRIFGWALEVFGALTLLGAVSGYVTLQDDDAVADRTALAWGLSATFAAVVILAIGAALVLFANYVLLQAGEIEDARLRREVEGDEE